MFAIAVKRIDQFENNMMNISWSRFKQVIIQPDPVYYKR